MIPANLRLMLSLRFSGKNAGVAQKTSENKPDPRTGQAREGNYPKTLSSPGFYGGYTPFSDSYEGVRHPKHRLALAPQRGPQSSDSRFSTVLGPDLQNQPNRAVLKTDGISGLPDSRVRLSMQKAHY